MIVGSKALIARYTSSVEQQAMLGGAAAAPQKSLDGPLNVLLLGIDERVENAEDTRADSIMILHIPASHDQAYLFSLPRDLEAEIPPFRKTKFRGSHEKINGAFFHGARNGGGRSGGFELLALTAKKITGLSFNAGAIVNFDGFKAVVKALGGVPMCVDTKRPVVSEHVGFDSKGNYRHPRDGGKPVQYNPGECRRFKDWEALDYVRQRKTLEDGDYGRQRHQQQFIKALAGEAKRQGVHANPLRLYELVNAAGRALTVDTHGASLETWLFTLRDIADNDLSMIKTNGGWFHSVPCGESTCEGLTPQMSELFAAVRENRVAEFLLQHPEFANAG
jgi:LCP family protein required for cell wall assembly